MEKNNDRFAPTFNIIWNPNKPMLANILIKRGLGKTITEVIKKYLYHKMPDDKLKTVNVIKKLSHIIGLNQVTVR